MALGKSWDRDGSRIPFERIAPEARLRPTILSGISYPHERDPEHGIAYRDVESGESDWAEVYDRRTGTTLFRAWRISQTSFAWQTSTMGAPAFMPLGEGQCVHLTTRKAPPIWRGLLSALVRASGRGMAGIGIPALPAALGST